MNKEELLRELSNKMSTGEISREEVIARFNLATSPQVKVADEDVPGFSITKMLYVFGAAIVIIGIIIFISQIWEDMGSFGRINVTLGLGLLITAIGSVLLNSKPDENIGSIFHFIGGMLVPGGALVTLYELSTGGYHPWVVAITFGIIFVFYLLLNFIHKSAVLTFFAIANGTTTVYLILNAIVGGPEEGWFGIKDVYQYLTMVIGVGYLLLGHAFRGTWNRNLVGALYFFGISGFLGAGFSQVFDSGIWQMIYFLIVFGGLFLSVLLKSRSVLVMSTLFLIAHVSYITGEYFADSIGWPISLVVLGFIIIGLGYASITISKKYINN
ncbi:MAG: DUF2157 domain-containing protein [Candidatus Taylorbacteria bacterium]|nr:DUF2157 domain-containing protein [Candidatus Taylorbacteria bacterium]